MGRAVIKVTIVYDKVPPSLNKMGSRGGHWPVTNAKKEWQRTIEGLLMAQRVPRNLRHVTVRATLRFPVVRGRDNGNFAWLLDKACGDALVNGGWLPADTPGHYRFADVTFDKQLGAPRTTLQLSYRTGT
jgi:hypothetical protein